MKIVTLVWSIGIGGTERAAVNYAVGYKRLGFDSRLIVLGEGYERLSDLKAAEVHTLLVSQCDEVDVKLSEIKHWNPDIIHIHHFSNELLGYVNLIRGSQTKVVETNVFSRPNFDKSYKAVDLSLQLSTWGYWKYTRLMKGSLYCPKVAIVPYIVDESRFKVPGKSEVLTFLNSYDIPDGAFVVGRVGQAFPSKWDLRLISVISNTIHPENQIYYLLVGVPPNLKQVILNKDDFFKSRVKLIDKIESDTALSLYYSSLSCFAHISKIGESFGYVLAEALLFKVPVITMVTPFKDNAQCELVGNNIGGHCVTTVAEFVESVLKLYKSKEMVIDLKKNLTDWISKRFSYNAVLPNQIHIYKSLIANSPIPHVDVTSHIKAHLKVFRRSKNLIFYLVKYLNTPFFYKIAAQLKLGLRRA